MCEHWKKVTISRCERKADEPSVQVQEPDEQTTAATDLEKDSNELNGEKSKSDNGRFNELTQVNHLFKYKNLMSRLRHQTTLKWTATNQMVRSLKVIMDRRFNELTQVNHLFKYKNLISRLRHQMTLKWTATNQRVRSLQVIM
ncbi:hypothetical protein DPMN_163929 [Dreissena polymorpha]|uniref:Uncharacterized protein n=1 Tax=Dreissena polymorpha TaxID=45954 RepID=A0A9D4EXK8_DREPO|nr:hypothetical protein DPMN_163929 [Dreissena polymorpha]